MHARRLRRHLRRIATFVLAGVPLCASAADAAMQAWGAYLFFAIVATVVIVLLLHEALDDDPVDDQHRDERAASMRDELRSTSALRYAHSHDDSRESRRVA